MAKFEPRPRGTPAPGHVRMPCRCREMGCRSVARTRALSLTLRSARRPIRNGAP